MILEQNERFYSLDVALAYCVGKQVIWKERTNCSCHGSCQSVDDEKNPACPTRSESTRGQSVRGPLLPWTAEEVSVLSWILSAKANPITGDHCIISGQDHFLWSLGSTLKYFRISLSMACKTSLFLCARVALLVFPSFSGTFLFPFPAPLWDACPFAPSISSETTRLMVGLLQTMFSFQ